jgi:hypothetical protein
MGETQPGKRADGAAAPTAAGKRDLKLLFLGLGALVAVGGTIITDVWKADVESKLERAQSGYSLLQTVRAQEYEQVQRARQDGETALVLAGGSDYAPELRYDAQYYAWDAASKIKARLEARAKEGASDDATSSAQSTPAPAPVCTLPPAPDPTMPNTVTDSRPQRARPGVSLVGTLSRPWECYNEQLTAAMVQDDDQIKKYDRKIRELSTIATITQLIGIGIAFGKDLIE